MEFLHRGCLLIGALLLMGCDRFQRSEVVLTPSARVTADSIIAALPGASPSVMRAIERLALGSGLSAVNASGCARSWELERLGQPYGNLHVCVNPRPKGELEVRIIEGPTTVWSPKADSLRRSIMDTLQQYGNIRALK